MQYICFLLPPQIWLVEVNNLKKIWEFIGKNLFLGATFTNWTVYLTKGVMSDKLNLQMSVEAMISFALNNQDFFIFLAVAGCHGIAWLTRFLIKTSRRWSEEKEDRLATKIAEKLKG